MKTKKPTTQTEGQLLAPSRLDFWLKKKYNVLLEGKHGVGKTSLVLDAIKRNHLRYVCLSGATMDPFIDFVGVPVKVKSRHGEETIDLLQPKYIKKANPQIIFIDEFNRSHKKVRNAVMELIQFKTINGQKISDDLRVVWAAVNPEDDTYDTDRLDPAQRDRFQVQVEIPYQCDRSYFKHKYGSKIADAAIEYWNSIPSDLRKQVSPRRLDYALQLINDGGDARDVLPVQANVAALTLALKSGPVIAQLEKIVHQLTNDEDDSAGDSTSSEQIDILKFFKDETNFDRSIVAIAKEKKYHPLAEHFPKEKMAACMSKYPPIRRYMIKSLKKDRTGSIFYSPLKEFSEAHQNQAVSMLIKKVLPKPPKKRSSSSESSGASNCSGKQKAKVKLQNKLPAGRTYKALITELKQGWKPQSFLLKLAQSIKGPNFTGAKFSSMLSFISLWAARNGLRLMNNSNNTAYKLV